MASIFTPTNFFLQNECVLEEYIFSENSLNRFRILDNKKSLKLIASKISTNNNFLIVPLHINNLVFRRKHLNLLIFNIRKKQITRIDPSNPNKTKIFKSTFRKEMKIFESIGFKFNGMSQKSKIIKHNGLCRYVSPLLWIYGKKLNRGIIRSSILEYLEYLKYLSNIT